MTRAATSDQTRGILRSTAVMGAAGVVRSLAAIARLKVFAVLLGPAGIGLLGVLQSITTMMVTLADFGLGSAATRELARVADEPRRAAAVRRAAMLLAVAFGGGGGALLWLLRRPLAAAVVGDPGQALAVGTLALAVPLSTLAAVRLGFLAAHRRVVASAVAQASAAVLATLAAIAIVAAFGAAGLPWTIVALMACLAGTARLLDRDRRRPRHSAPPGAGPLRALLRVGAAATTVTVATAGMDLAVRAYWTRRWDLDHTGQFQAAWSVSMLVTGLTLAALSVDYLPAASARRSDGGGLAQLLRVQLGFSLLCAAPALAAITCFPEVVTRLLYSPAFELTPAILRWQAGGELLRIAFWILTTTLLAGGMIRAYVAIQLAWNFAYLGCLVALVERLGPASAGAALALSYVVPLVAQAVVLGRRLGFAPLRPGLRRLAALAAACAAIAGLQQWRPAAAAPPAAYLLTVLVVLYCLLRLGGSLRAAPPADD